MKELSLHILDLGENSLAANAKLIKIIIIEDLKRDILKITIEDDGKGMDKELLKIADDPFFTTRTTRSVGLGLSLMKASAKRCEGDLKILSVINKGTKVECEFCHSHIDRAPIGNIGETLVTLINHNKKFDILYIHEVDENKFVFDTREIKQILNGVKINSPDVLLWIKDYIIENMKKIHNNVND